MPSWKLSKELGLLRDLQLVPTPAVSLVDESHGLNDIMQPRLSTSGTLTIIAPHFLPMGVPEIFVSYGQAGSGDVYTCPPAAATAAHSSVAGTSIKSSGTLGGRDLFAYPLFGMSFQCLSPRGSCSLLSPSRKHAPLTRALHGTTPNSCTSVFDGADLYR